MPLLSIWTRINERLPNAGHSGLAWAVSLARPTEIHWTPFRSFLHRVCCIFGWLHRLTSSPYQAANDLSPIDDASSSWRSAAPVSEGSPLFANKPGHPCDSNLSPKRITHSVKTSKIQLNGKGPWHSETPPPFCGNPCTCFGLRSNQLPVSAVIPAVDPITWIQASCKREHGGVWSCCNATTYSQQFMVLLRKCLRAVPDVATARGEGKWCMSWAAIVHVAGSK